ncbi:serine/arginine-rich splicing factor 10-like [Oppia nitens]|uniref:serine/arginine-rich splicing factor 10-like n=1 Tax=Oppia nitens TaxID=1686743 RepID=UPI0023DCD7E3|nr:serine/arginine-rich splicing factor 10-like [Oppia nitens]
MPRSFGPSNRSLFVRNVAEVTRSEDLRNLFNDYGHVTDVYIPLDYYTHRPRGFAYVQFDELRAAEEAVHNLDRVRLFGRELEVEFAQGDRKTPSEMRVRERGVTYRGGGGGGHSRRYNRDNRRDDWRRRSRSRSRDRTDKRHRSRHRSRSRSRSPQRSHRRRNHSHSRSRSKSNSRSKSRKGHESTRHKSSRHNDKEPNNHNKNHDNYTNDKFKNEEDIEFKDKEIKEEPRNEVNELEERNHSTNTTPSSIEQTNGDKHSLSGDSKEDNNDCQS